MRIDNLMHTELVGSPQREQIWSKRLEIYKAKMLSKGEYLGSVYDIGFDLPEAHVIRKHKKMYYAFYAKTSGGSGAAWAREEELSRSRLCERPGLGDGLRSG